MRDGTTNRQDRQAEGRKIEGCRKIGRLKRRPDFLRVAAARRSAARPGVVVQAAAMGEDQRQHSHAPVRVGFTVTRKVGGAVVRNRVKRRLRAVADRVLPDHAAAGTDLVLIGRNGTAGRDFADLVGDLKSALRQLRVWRADGSRDARNDGCGDRRGAC